MSENEIKKVLGPAMYSRIGCCIEYIDLTVEQKNIIIEKWYDEIMEKLNGGGHFSAAAVERADVSVQQMKDMILKCIEEEQNNESNIA